MLWPSQASVSVNIMGQLSLSPSRANDFRQCPLLYRYRAIDKLPEPKSRAQLLGTLVHGVLEEMFDWPRPERTYPRAVKALKPTWAGILEEKSEEEQQEISELIGEGEFMDFLIDAREMLRGYFVMENPQGFDPHSREKFVKANFDRTPALGFIDRVDVAPTGEIRVVDYKTGKMPTPRFADKAVFQLRFYALLYWRSFGKIPDQLKLMYLKNQDSIVRRPFKEDLEALEDELNKLWEEITSCGASGDFPPKKSRLCDWCAFYAHCPAMGGTVLDYPGWPGS